MEQQIQYCSPKELFDQVRNGQQPDLIDVRALPEFERERIPSSKHFPISVLSEKASELSPDSMKVMICRKGVMAAKAGKQLRALGFNEVCVLAGGLDAWREAGLPIEAAEGQTWTLERQVRLAAGLLVFIGVLLTWLVSAKWLLLPGFVGAGLIFAAVTDFCGMGLLLSRLPWNQRTAG